MSGQGSGGQPLQLSGKAFRERYAKPTTFWSWHVSYRIGAILAPPAIRLGLRPSTISFVGLSVSVASSGLVLAINDRSPIAAAAVAFLGWQLAYALDCTDGQVARATGGGKPEGSVLDLTVDWLVHTVVLATLAWLIGTEWPGGLTGVASVGISASWLFSLAYEGWARDLGKQYTLKGRHAAINVARQARDYGVQAAALALSIAFGPAAIAVVLLVVSGLNAAFILQRVVVLSR